MSLRHPNFPCKTQQLHEIDPQPKHDAFLNWRISNGLHTVRPALLLLTRHVKICLSVCLPHRSPKPHSRPQVLIMTSRAAMQAVAKAAAQTRQPFSPPSDRTPGPLPPRAPPAATTHRGLSLLTFSAGVKRAWRAWLSTSRDERADTAYTCMMYTRRQMWFRFVPCFPLSPVRQRLSRQSDSIAVWATIVTLPPCTISEVGLCLRLTHAGLIHSHCSARQYHDRGYP